MTMSGLPPGPFHILYHTPDFMKPRPWKQNLWHFYISVYARRDVGHVHKVTVPLLPVLTLNAGENMSLRRPGPAATGMWIPFR